MIDLDAPLTTRGGREVRIYARDGAGAYPIHGAIFADTGWRIERWSKDGRYYCQANSSDNDLINTPVKREG